MQHKNIIFYDSYPLVKKVGAASYHFVVMRKSNGYPSVSGGIQNGSKFKYDMFCTADPGHDETTT